MKQNYTDINIVLDRSGSMDTVKDDTIGGFNAFLKAQQEAPGEATITLAQFDDVYEVVYQTINIKDAKPLNSATFVPRGSTALLDAIGRTINEVGAKLSKLSEDQRPAKVVFVILTDGHENASKEFTRAGIDQMIKHQRDFYAWEFVFLGANQDAIAAAKQIGIQAANALTYAANAQGTSEAFGSVSKNLINYRSGVVQDMSFDEDDRKKQKQSGA